MTYIVFRLMFFLRKIVKLITTVSIVCSGFYAVMDGNYPKPTEYYLIIIFGGIVPFLIRIYYDKILIKIANKAGCNVIL